MPSAIVIGAGVFGASLAHRLAGERLGAYCWWTRRSRAIRARVRGESRLIRCSHGPDRWYTRSARRPRELWRELEEETGRSLFVDAGLVWLAHREDGWESESERSCGARGSRWSAWVADGSPTSTRACARDDLAFGLYEPEAGVMRAREAARALADAAVARGARLELAEALPDGAGVRLGERRLEADLVVWACGAWLGRLFPGLLELRVTEQALFFVDVPPAWSTPPLPAFVDYDGAAYGLGALDGNGMKVGSDLDGPAFDPDTWPRTPPRDSERMAREFLAPALPGSGRRPLPVRARSCHYSLTSDTHFIAAPHPEHDTGLDSRRRLGPRLQARPGDGGAGWAISSRAAPTRIRASRSARAGRTAACAPPAAERVASGVRHR